jgi:hypothetical protein
MAGDYVLAFPSTVREIVDLRHGAVEDRHREALALHVENQVFRP